MKRAYLTISLILLVAIGLSSCRKEDPMILNPKDQLYMYSWDEVFESFWNGMNYSYVYWDIDPTDWDEVYIKYKPLFKRLERGNKNDSLSAISYFYEMTENLIDHHYALTIYSEDGVRNAAKISPGHIEAGQRDYYHEPFNRIAFESIIYDNRTAGRIEQFSQYENRYGDLKLYSYLLDDNIAYLYVSAFEMDDYLNETELQETLNNFYDIINSTDNLKGIIIDVRNNSGGYLSDLYLVLAPLIKEEITFGYTRSKIGMGRLDYSPWSPMILYPSKTEHYKWLHKVERDISDMPIVGIADINSVSMAEMTAIVIDELPNGVLVGERTFGAHGPLNQNYPENFTGTLSNRCFRIYTSTSMVKRTDGKCYEGIGIIPDIEALYDEERFLSGEDTQLEAAVQYLKSR